ncbi:LysR family transcriptional regulator [Azoarcus sp. KH32C]|uniref:LysR family transcriptional regulator n=1 Tax=Azoarcus sp. KH32C TaxID=748247 RepID=UPI0002386C5D|nr:LysR family transcriptional regulator [Azoarcus sp. KH32C]BAL24354.1 hypothetical protein AZKH_2041 [Azoarcus sp. KH32C]
MVDIDHRLFRHLDLNLLVAFDAIIDERNVSRAAERLCIGQPAASHALARLRKLFGDELLFRQGASMQPTRRALELAAVIRPWLSQALALARSGQEFDPGRVSGRVRIALGDPLEALLLPGLMARVRELAPGLEVSVQPIPVSAQIEALDRGEISLAVGHFACDRETHQATLLSSVGFDYLYAPALVDLPAEPSLADILVPPHIHTSYAGEQEGLVDRALKQQGLSRRVVVRAATPLSIPFVVKQSPLVAIVPKLITRLFAAHSDLRIATVPLPELVLPVIAVRHRRDRSDPLLDFVESQLVAAAEALFGERPQPM